MKRIVTAISLLVLVSGVTARAQTKSAQPSPEYRVLDAWTGSWLLLGEARDTPSGPVYKSEWSYTGQRILGGFFLEVHHREKFKGTVEEFLELMGYDPPKKACISHVYGDSGRWEISSLTFINERTCVENGTTYYPDGRTKQWRFTWTFGPDGKSVSVKEEDDKDGTWWTAYEGKGVKSPGK
jgi:hypothetical protein